jgi:hypothetical protein
LFVTENVSSVASYGDGAHLMTKPKSGVSNEALLGDLVNRVASIEGYLTTLFAMQCEVIALLTNSQSGPIVEEWGKVKLDFLNQCDAALLERLGELAGS